MWPVSSLLFCESATRHFCTHKVHFIPGSCTDKVVPEGVAGIPPSLTSIEALWGRVGRWGVEQGRGRVFLLAGQPGEGRSLDVVIRLHPNLRPRFQFGPM